MSIITRRQVDCMIGKMPWQLLVMGRFAHSLGGLKRGLPLVGNSDEDCDAVICTTKLILMYV